MLTSDLLMYRIQAGAVVPRALGHTRTDLERAVGVIELFGAFHGRTRGELDDALREDEGESTDYRVRRGLAHLLYSERCEFQTQAIVDPSGLRERVFQASARERPTLETTPILLESLAFEVSSEVGREVSSAELEKNLYADLRENQVIAFEPVTPEWLIDRYNLAQAQGVLYRASELVITAHRNDPGEYKLLWRYLKLFGLMHRVTGDADAGYTIVLDGPASLFKPSTRYGISFAKFLPGLLNVTRWSLDALIHPKNAFGDGPEEAHFTLDTNTDLRSHYPRGKVFDSILEQGFAARFTKSKTDWRLEREVDLVDLGGTVLIPDFRLIHPDGRAISLEIVGFWRPDYLMRKFEKIRRSGRRDLVIAVSQKLNLGDAAKKLEGLEDQVVFFKGSLEPKAVLEVAERLESRRVQPVLEV
jgi:predicted nuclease of restriction endonuclease-like RecB superfamily